MNKSKLFLFMFFFILWWSDGNSQRKKVREDFIQTKKSAEIFTQEDTREKRNYLVSLTSSYLNLSAPSLTQWSPVFRQYNLDNTSDIRYDIQYLEKYSYSFKSGSNIEFNFKFLKPLTRRWGLSYGLSYGFMRFSYDDGYQNLGEHIVNEVRGTTPTVISEPLEIIPINEPKPHQEFNFNFGFGQRDFHVHNLLIPLELNFALSKTWGLGWVNNLMVPFHTTEKYENNFGFIQIEEPQHELNHEFMNRLVFNTGLSINYTFENTIQFSLSMMNNINSLTHNESFGFGRGHRSHTNMAALRIEVGYKF